MTKCKRCTNCTAGIMCQCGKKITKEKNESHVNHPRHYLKDSGHEVIDVIGAWNLNFELGNAIKYIARAGKKDVNKKREDLEKALWYIKREIDKN